MNFYNLMKNNIFCFAKPLRFLIIGHYFDTPQRIYLMADASE